MALLGMLIPRTAELCIACLKEPPFSDGFDFSEEHVIPAALGGILTCKFLCKSCNDGFGNGFEARAKTDPSIRLAIGNLKDKLPALYASIEEGQSHIINTEAGVLPATYSSGKIRGKIKKLPDNSLIYQRKLRRGNYEKSCAKTVLEQLKLRAFCSATRRRQKNKKLNLHPVGL